MSGGGNRLKCGLIQLEYIVFNHNYKEVVNNRQFVKRKFFLMLIYRPRKDAELPGLEKVENLICAQIA